MIRVVIYKVIPIIEVSSGSCLGIDFGVVESGRKPGNVLSFWC